jgi:hypothetical protein
MRDVLSATDWYSPLPIDVIEKLESKIQEDREEIHADRF